MNRVVANYADEMVLFACLLGAALLLAHLWHRFLRTAQQPGVRPRRIFAALAVLSLGPFLYVTLSQGYGTGRHLSLVPLHEITVVRHPAMGMSSVTLVNMGGNIALLLAFGALFPFALHGQNWIPLKVTATAMALSTAVEAAQFGLALGRVSSVDDVLLNMLGAALGAWATRRWWSAALLPRYFTASWGTRMARQAARDLNNKQRPGR